MFILLYFNTSFHSKAFTQINIKCSMPVKLHVIQYRRNQIIERNNRCRNCSVVIRIMEDTSSLVTITLNSWKKRNIKSIVYLLNLGHKKGVRFLTASIQ